MYHAEVPPGRTMYQAEVPPIKVMHFLKVLCVWWNVKGTVFCLAVAQAKNVRKWPGDVISK